ncbi:type III pantothenate kinase [bacterium]|nr:type III pantothenate kinase [bacterium]
MIALLHAQTGLSVQRASSPAQFQNWRSGYLAPAALGVDRFLGMLGALNVWPAQMRVVALVGTALTIDVVQPDGQHLGGLIAPGPSLMQASLHRSTADLPLGGGQYAALAHATRDAIYSGSVAAAAALIQRVVATYTNSQLILSGGAAQMLLPALNERPQWPRLDLQPDLVLRGLWRYAEAEQATG